jgi:hypothetical protein
VNIYADVLAQLRLLSDNVGNMDTKYGVLNLPDEMVWGELSRPFPVEWEEQRKLWGILYDV